MALKDWLSGPAATSATPATHCGEGGRTVATVATVAVATSAELEAREERAAILEFLAGYSRAEAERVAGILH